jgi:lysyl-tRNA synthetase class 2
MNDNKDVQETLEQENEQDLSEQRIVRREKLKALQEAGRNPFLIEEWDQNAYSQDIKDDFDRMEGKDVSVAGRIMAKRVMGKASFTDLQDYKGKIQLHVKKDVLGEEEYKWLLWELKERFSGLNGEKSQ